MEALTFCFTLSNPSARPCNASCAASQTGCCSSAFWLAVLSASIVASARTSRSSAAFTAKPASCAMAVASATAFCPGPSTALISASAEVAEPLRFDCASRLFSATLLAASCADLVKEATARVLSLRFDTISASTPLPNSPESMAALKLPISISKSAAADVRSDAAPLAIPAASDTPMGTVPSPVRELLICSAWSAASFATSAACFAWDRVPSASPATAPISPAFCHFPMICFTLPQSGPSMVSLSAKSSPDCGSSLPPTEAKE
mmetsp:Transcript_24450/g.44865  ORF Transcript_24450/g.44865 Transcript_24450/m.44865 type:complete len:263 (-) Transcript_24450:148-936(-)